MDRAVLTMCLLATRQARKERPVKITKRTVDAQLPKEKTTYLWDSNLSGFGVKILPSGKKTYLVQYRIGGRRGRTRRYTIGVHGAITTDQARNEAKKLLAQVSMDVDPAAQRDKAKQAHTVGDLLDRFLSEYVETKLSPRTQVEYETVIRLKIPQWFKRLAIHEPITRDISRIHQGMNDMPTRANKTLSVLSKFFNWCEQQGYRNDHTNPCRHVKKYREVPRQRYLSQAEQQRLGDALRRAGKQNFATIYTIEAIRMLLFTGARLREILDLKWEYIRSDEGILMLPRSKTGPKTIYLNPQSLEVLERIPRQHDNPFVFCGLQAGQPIINIQKPWRRIRELADLEDVRLHDLRHTFASIAVINGMSLPLLGALLGHSKPSTTARYAHLAADPLKVAASQVGTNIQL